MLSAQQICQLARLQVGDSAHTKFSDYECVMALQAALDLLVSSCDSFYSPLLVKKATLVSDDGSYAVPKDFRSIVKVTDADGRPIESEYSGKEGRKKCRFKGGLLVSNAVPVLKLTYRYRPERLTTVASKIDVPHSLEIPLARMTASILKGDFEAAQGLSDKTAQDAKAQLWENNYKNKLWGRDNP